MSSSEVQRNHRSRWILIASALGLLVLASCTHLGYYSQSLLGGGKVLAKRRPVAKLVDDASTPAALRERLELALEMREFAVTELYLPDNKSYRTYADLDRTYAVWNIVAAPELSIEARTWCFLFVGCVSYRGYFSEHRAEQFADKLRNRGYDVDVGGVTAYSTIGWFADPLLSTFIERSEPYLAGLIFHELAHQVVYLKGDSTFNESFAMAVEEEGALRWLAHRGLEDQIDSYRRVKGWEKEFSELALGYRAQLAAAYAADESDDWKRRRKAEILDAMRADYADLKQSWGGYEGFDGWFDRDLNNARLALVGVYHQLVPGFLDLLAERDGDLGAFYDDVRRIGELDRGERHERLESGASSAKQQEATR